MFSSFVICCRTPMLKLLYTLTECLRRHEHQEHALIIIAYAMSATASNVDRWAISAVICGKLLRSISLKW